MRAFICDDEKSTCAELERFLLEYANQRNIKLDVDVFFSGRDLIKHLVKEKTPDILLLDIVLPDISGIKIGAYIRRKMEDEQMFIIYISSKEQYAMQLFKNRPFDFLVKPLKEQQIYHILDDIYDIVGKSNRIFEYQNKGVGYRIQYREILYFQSVGREINIVKRKGRETFYGKLAHVKKAIPEDLFLNIHKSYLVNFEYIKTFAYEWVKLRNGDKLTISKANRKKVRENILKRGANEI